MRLRSHTSPPRIELFDKLEAPGLRDAVLADPQGVAFSVSGLIAGPRAGRYSRTGNCCTGQPLPSGSLNKTNDEEVELWTGEQLEHREVARAGDYIYIPAGVPHIAVNRTETPAAFLAARTDPNEQESVVMRPDLEAKVP